MTSITRIAAFVGKDIRDALGSHTLSFLLMVPVLISVFFSQISDDKIRRPCVALSDNKSAFAQALKISGNLQVKEFSSESGEEIDLKKKIKDRLLDAAIIIPPGFDEDIKNDLFPRIDIYLGSNMAQNSAVKEAVKASLRRLAGQELPADLYTENVCGNNDSDSAELSVLCIWLCFTCIAGLMIAASTFVEEKEHKTLNAILMTPAKFWEISAGHIVSGTIMPVLSALLVVIINKPSSVTFGVIILITLGSAVFAAIGVALGMFVKSQTAANAISSAIYLLLFIPLVMADFNNSIQKFCYILPSYYLNNGLYGAIADSKGISSLLNEVAPLAAILVLVLLVVGKGLKNSSLRS
ncbi:MAG: ABC transporter permease [bacterium]|nr:ABC transporter permease [bacterium]